MIQSKREMWDHELKDLIKPTLKESFYCLLVIVAISILQIQKLRHRDGDTEPGSSRGNM